MSGTGPGSATAFTVNGRPVTVAAPPLRRLADALRDDLGLTGTKIGCNAGDCGARTVLLDGAQVCSCMVSLAQTAGRDVTTVEGLAAKGRLNRLQRASLRHGAAQCGACTPGMLIAATELLRANPRPRREDVMDSLGGVLCRCTGYRKIVRRGAGCGERRPATLAGAPAWRSRRRAAAEARRRAQAHRGRALRRRCRAGGRTLALHRPLAP